MFGGGIMRPVFRSALLASCIAVVAPFVTPSTAVASAPSRFAGSDAVSAPVGVPIMIADLGTLTITVPQVNAPALDYMTANRPSVQLIGDGFEYAAATQYFVHPDTNLQASSIYIEALTSATDMVSPGVSLTATNGSAPVVGQVNGADVFLSPSSQPGTPAEIQWLPEAHTQVTIGAVGSDAVPTSTLLNIAAGLQLVSSGQSLPAASADGSTSPDQPLPPDAQPQATCDTTCPTASNMRGTGALSDDWDVNHEICDHCSVTRGNTVGIWQAILWADYTEYDNLGNRITNCDVDGIFGNRTTSATYFWQDFHFAGTNVSSDGIVGPTTWDFAAQYLKPDGSLVAYRGGEASLYFKRSTSANDYYSWSWNYSPYYYSGYTGIQIVKTTSNACHTAP